MESSRKREGGNLKKPQTQPRRGHAGAGAGPISANYADLANRQRNANASNRGRPGSASARSERVKFLCPPRLVPLESTSALDLEFSEETEFPKQAQYGENGKGNSNTAAMEGTCSVAFVQSGDSSIVAVVNENSKNGNSNQAVKDGDLQTKISTTLPRNLNPSPSPSTSSSTPAPNEISTPVPTTKIGTSRIATGNGNTKTVIKVPRNGRPTATAVAKSKIPATVNKKPNPSPRIAVKNEIPSITDKNGNSRIVMKNEKSSNTAKVGNSSTTAKVENSRKNFRPTTQAENSRISVNIAKSTRRSGTDNKIDTSPNTVPNKAVSAGTVPMSVPMSACFLGDLSKSVASSSGNRRFRRVYTFNETKSKSNSNSDARVNSDCSGENLPASSSSSSSRKSTDTVIAMPSGSSTSGANAAKPPAPSGSGISQRKSGELVTVQSRKSVQTIRFKDATSRYWDSVMASNEEYQKAIAELIKEINDGIKPPDPERASYVNQKDNKHTVQKFLDQTPSEDYHMDEWNRDLVKLASEPDENPEEQIFKMIRLAQGTDSRGEKIKILQIRKDGNDLAVCRVKNLYGGGICFLIQIPIRNISKNWLTYRVQTSDDTKYIISNPFGFLKPGLGVYVNIKTRKPNKWSFVDLESDSIQILAANFYLLRPEEEESASNWEKQLAAAKFWHAHGRAVAPGFRYTFADEHVIRGLRPFLPDYSKEPSMTPDWLFSHRSWRKFMGQLMEVPYKEDLEEFQSSKFLMGSLTGGPKGQETPGMLFMRDTLEAYRLSRNKASEFNQLVRAWRTKFFSIVSLAVSVALAWFGGNPWEHYVRNRVFQVLDIPIPEPEPEPQTWLDYIVALILWPFSWIFE